jgi:hypothetical protein
MGEVVVLYYNIFLCCAAGKYFKRFDLSQTNNLTYMKGFEDYLAMDAKVRVKQYCNLFRAKLYFSIIRWYKTFKYNIFFLIGKYTILILIKFLINIPL